MTSAKALHGLVYLDFDEAGSLCVTANASLSALAGPDELPPGRFELHWWDSPRAATAFKEGVLAAGRNSIAAMVGTGEVAAAVLLHFESEDRPDVATLNEAVELVLHAAPEMRRANIAWKESIDSIRRSWKSDAATIKGVRIVAREEDRIELRVSYWAWRGSLYNGLPGGDNHVAVEWRGDKMVLLAPVRIFKGIQEAPVEFWDEMVNVAAEADGFAEGDTICFPVEGDLMQRLEELSPTFYRLHQVAYAAEGYNKISEYRADKAANALIRTMNKGAELQIARRWDRADLIAPDGSQKRVSVPLVSRMIKAGMIACDEPGRDKAVVLDPMPPIEFDPRYYLDREKVRKEVTSTEDFVRSFRLRKDGSDATFKP